MVHAWFKWVQASRSMKADSTRHSVRALRLSVTALGKAWACWRADAARLQWLDVGRLHRLAAFWGAWRDAPPISASRLQTRQEQSVVIHVFVLSKAWGRWQAAAATRQRCRCCVSTRSKRAVLAPPAPSAVCAATAALLLAAHAACAAPQHCSKQCCHPTQTHANARKRSALHVIAMGLLV